MKDENGTGTKYVSAGNPVEATPNGVTRKDGGLTPLLHNFEGVES